MKSYKQNGPHPATVLGTIQLLLGLGAAYMGLNSSDSINYYGMLFLGVSAGLTGISQILKGRSSKMSELILSDAGIQILNHTKHPEYEHILQWDMIGSAKLQFPNNKVKNIFSLILYNKDSRIAREVESFSQFADHQEALKTISEKIDQSIEGM